MTWVLYKVAPSYFLAITTAEFRRWISILALTTILLPFLVIGLLRVSRLISNARMHNARDRVLPLLGSLVFYAWAFYFFTVRVTAPLLLRSLLLGSCLSIVIIFFINIYYKVSVHTTAAAIMPGVLVALLAREPGSIIVVFMLALIAAALVGIVRWLLGAHTTGQIILGYIIGISMQVAAYFFLRPRVF
jgi:fructose-specific phosphotransferase system IIC component